MKLSKFIALAVVMLFATSAIAQKNFTKDADLAFEAESYYSAIEKYKSAFPKERSKAKKALILFRLGECYRHLEQDKQATTWYRKAIKVNYAEQDAKAYYYLAEVLKEQGNYDEALIEYQNYVAAAPTDKHGAMGVESCKLATKWKNAPTDHEVDNEVLLNSKQYDFSPTFADRKFKSLIFTSTRDGSTGEGLDGNTGENASDLWMATRDRKGKWGVPTRLQGEEISTASNEGSATLNKRKNMMYFTKCDIEKKHEHGCAIYTAKKQGQKWATVELFKISDAFVGDHEAEADSVYHTFGHPSLSAKDDIIFFASDMDGGQGGKDIWFKTFNKKTKEWSAPINAGKDVNTDGDELFPFIALDGTLYFASDGHLGMGGLDNFKAPSTGTNKWGNVENLKSPLNSPANDFGIIFEGDKQRGYFTSNRKGGKGGDDIWTFFVPPLVYIIQGTVNDVETEEPIANARVILKGTDGTSVEVETDAKGFYKFGQLEGSKDWYVKEKTSYTIFVSKTNYLNSKGKESTIGVEESTTFVHDFGLQSTKTTEIKFPEVLYDLGKFTLREESKDSLNFLYQVLVDNPTIVIELSAHTDSRGSVKSNNKLSENRAKSCVEYLVSKGIPAERMVPKGYGESSLIFSDSDIAKLKTKEEQEAAHQKNRRTVFKVLNSDYVPKAQPESEAPAEDAVEEPGEE